MESTPPVLPDSQPDIMSDSQQNVGRSKKKMVRFSAGEDVVLLREVLSDNPFEVPARWDVIAGRMRAVSPKDFNKRNCKERTEYLVKMFKKGEREVLKKSGTEEEYSEREHLLEEIRDLQESTVPIKRGKRSKAEADKEEGKRLRLASAAEAVRPSTCNSQDHNNEHRPLFISTNCDGALQFSFGSETSPPHQMSHSPPSLRLPPSSPPHSPLATSIPQHQPASSSSDEQSRPQLPSSSSPSILSASSEADDDVTPDRGNVIPRTPVRSLLINKPITPLPSVVPTTSSKQLLINSATPYAASSQRKAALNKAVMEHMGKKQEYDREKQSKTLELELLKAQNEKMRLHLEERKQSMLVDAQEKKMVDFEKKIDSLFDIQLQNALSIEKRIDSISEKQEKILELLSTIAHK